MTIPFGEDDLNFLNSQLSNSDDQFNNIGDLGLTNVNNFTTNGDISPFGDFQGTNQTDINDNNTVTVTNGFGINTATTGQQDSRMRRQLVEETNQINETFTTATGGVNGVTTGTTGQSDEITRVGGGQGGTTTDTTTVGTEGTLPRTVPGGGTETTPVCSEGYRQCGPALAINPNDSSALCCGITDSCCSTGDSYYCSSGPCSATTPSSTSTTTTTGTVGVNPCGGCPSGYECREAVGGYQCINPLEDPCANNGNCGDPRYFRCSYLQGANFAVCNPIATRQVWESCETGATIEGTPPSSLVQSTDIFGRTCFRQPDTQRVGYRVCGTSDIQNGTPPQNLINTADQLGSCYEPPATWRQCGDSFQTQTGSPPAGLGLAQDNFGQCYDTTWKFCGNPTFNNRGTPPINYEFDGGRGCWNEKTADIGPSTCAGSTFGNCPVGQICTSFEGPEGINYVCRTPFREERQEELPPPTPSITVTAPPPTPTITVTAPPPTPTIIVPTPTITVTIPPTPTPTPPPTPRIVWRDCISGNLKDGFAPSNYREVAYTGAGGGTCWEPATVIGFSPSLEEALYFTHQRGTGNYPQPKTITATNPSYAISYNVKITTNASIIVSPTTFTLEPRKSADFIVNVTPELIGQLGDGKSTLSMTVEIKEL